MKRPEEGHDTHHPDLLRIDAIRAGEGTVAEKAHLDNCPSCREALTNIQQSVDTLRKAHTRPAPVPPEIDDAVLREFRSSIASREKSVPFPVWRRWLLPAAAAAASLVLVLSLPMMKERAYGPDSPVGDRAEVPSLTRVAGGDDEDINRDGRIDILDAFLLARMIGEEAATAKPDFNGDGLTDDADVDLLAYRAVSLREELL